MAKELSHNRARRDRSKIDLANQAETKFWARELGIGLPELEKLVEKVGNSAAAVRKELGTPKDGRAPTGRRSAG